MPNFFILGAPKCGTTSLASGLAAHPQIFMSPIKEPHHFNTDMRHQIIRDRSAYQALFDAAGETQQIGEASVWYLYSRAAVPKIERECPGARYIVCVRNPVDMAYSLYHQQVFSGSETAATFEEAWSSSRARSKGEGVPRHALDPQTLIYHEACALGTQLERLLDLVPRERVHVLALDDLVQSPRESLEGVQRFLGVDVDGSGPLTTENSAKIRRSMRFWHLMRAVGRIKRAAGLQKSFGILTAIDRMNRKQSAYQPMSADTRALLRKAFATEMERLEIVIGRRFEAWRST